MVLKHVFFLQVMAATIITTITMVAAMEEVGSVETKEADFTWVVDGAEEWHSSNNTNLIGEPTKKNKKKGRLLEGNKKKKNVIINLL